MCEIVNDSRNKDYWGTRVQASDRCQGGGNLGQGKALTKMKYA